MPIFTINKDTDQALDIRFSERYSEKLARHLAKYSILLEPGTETVGEKFVNLCVLVIGAKKPTTSKPFNFCKLKVTELGEFKFKEEFLKSGENIPAPLLFIYRKNKKGLPIADPLFKILECYYNQLVEAHKKKFNALKYPAQNAVNLNELYKAEVEILGEKLLLEISEKDFDIDVKGVLLDEFFVHKYKEATCLERNFDSSALRVSEKIPEKIPDVPENPQHEVSLSAKVDKVSNSLYIWSSPELKDNAKKIILAYQKHLSKQYFFRSKGDDLQAKLCISRKLLCVLEEKYEDFIDYLNEIDKSVALDVHRDLSIIQKIGMFFKGEDTKTKGRNLINNLLAIVEDDRALRRDLDLNSNSL